MKVKNIKNRSILFTFNNTEWNLNIHLMLGKKYNYIIDTGLGPNCIHAINKYIPNNNPVIVINTHYH